MSDFPAYRDGVQAAFPPDNPALFQTLDVTRARVARAVHPQVVALQIFALAMALVGLLVVSQVIARRLSAEGGDNALLQALGTTRGERFAVNLAVVAVLALAGAVLAVAVAVAVTPLVPVGVTSVMDPHPGIPIDVVVLGLGLLAVALATFLIGVVPAWRTARIPSGDDARRPSRLVALLAGAGFGPAATTGVRFAFEPGRGRSALPVRATLVAAVTAVAVVAGTVTFAGSLDRLVDHPSLYGSGWDATLDYGSQGGGPDTGMAAIIHRSLDANPAVRGYSEVIYNEIAIDGQPVPSVAFDRSDHPVEPTIVEGRAPTSPGEVALAAGTIDDLGKGIGDEVTATSTMTGQDHQLEVVGRVVLPGVGSSSGSNHTALGQGALITVEDMANLFAVGTSSSLVVISLAPGAERAQLQADLMGDLSAVPGGDQLVLSPVARPSDVVALARLRRTPFLLASLLVLLVAATVANALFVAVRRRRFDLAVLKTLGETRRQLLGTSPWQASSTAFVAVVVGVPVGVVLGRWIWRALADAIGVVADPVTPWIALGLVAVVVLVLANVVGLVPGTRAARTSPAAVLRSE